MAVPNFTGVDDRVARLQHESETLRVAGTWSAVLSIVGTIIAGMVFPAIATLIGTVATGTAATMLYRRLSDQRELARLQGSARDVVTFGRS